ncbi:MAG: hypothetical protein RLZZ522_2271 [Verrucomicrobiota bacterium]|jgi:hypothetical protein
MLAKLLIAWILMALCVVIHAIGLAVAGRWLKSRLHHHEKTFWRAIRLLVDVAGWTIFLHLIEIGVWAIFYTVGGGMPDLPTAFYFSIVTYTTTGYGDVVLPPEWRMVGGVEALTGILMCGLSSGLFFAVVTRMFARRFDSQPD